jgi:pimeloyl-ACP methyl ester carboxylesterase
MVAVRRRVVDVGGRTHLADFGGGGPVMVLLHGLGGSHVNWVRVGPKLAERARVVAPDLPGFGLSPPGGRSTTVEANAAWVGRFLREEAEAPAILVGNSMGGLISILTGVLNPADVAGLILLDPALPLAPSEPRDMEVLLGFTAYMVPGVGEAFVRRRARVLGPEGMVRETFRVCTVDPSRVPEDVIRAHVDVTDARTTMSWANPAVLRAARSMLRMLLRRRRFREVLERVRPPTLLINGAGDRLVKLAAARVASEVRPDWDFVPLDDVGHVPQLEDPDRTVEAIWTWLDGSGREAWERAAGAAAEPAGA